MDSHHMHPSLSPCSSSCKRTVATRPSPPPHVLSPIYEQINHIFSLFCLPFSMAQHQNRSRSKFITILKLESYSSIGALSVLDRQPAREAPPSPSEEATAMGGDTAEDSASSFGHRDSRAFGPSSAVSRVGRGWRWLSGRGQRWLSGRAEVEGWRGE